MTARPDPPAIATERENELANNELDAPMPCDPGTPAGRRVDGLVALVDAWEVAHDIRSG